MGPLTEKIFSNHCTRQDMNRQFLKERYGDHTHRVETRTDVVVEAHVPILGHEVAEVVGSQLYGCILRYMDNCEIQFDSLFVSALDEIKTS